MHEYFWLMITLQNYCGWMRDRICVVRGFALSFTQVCICSQAASSVRGAGDYDAWWLVTSTTPGL
jgi:hypothetical protein